MPITLYHAFPPPVAKHFVEIVQEYNGSSSEKVELISGTNYNEIVARGLKEGGYIIQSSEFMTGEFAAGHYAFIPMQELLAPNRVATIAPLIKATFSDNQGQLIGWPFNPSCGVLYINRSALQAGGYGEDFVPGSITELFQTAQELQRKGVKPFALGNAWHVAYHFEIRKAQKGEPLFLPDNGRSGPARLCVTTADDIAYLTQLAQEQQKGTYIHTPIDARQANLSFIEGKVAFYMQGASNSAALLEGVGQSFVVETAVMPLYPTTVSRQAFPLGGAALVVPDQGWAKERLEGVRHFLDYISSPEVQEKWHVSTGYTPISADVVARLRAKGFYDTHPMHAQVVEQTIEAMESPQSLGIRVPGYDQIRLRIGATLDAFLQSGELDPLPFFKALENEVNADLAKTYGN